MSAQLLADHDHDVRIALQNEIRPQIVAFKQSAFLGHDFVLCAVTGEPVEEQVAHVDHAAPLTFDAICRAFFEATKIAVADVAVVGKAVDGAVTLTLGDRALAAIWFEFHRKSARLRIVTQRANISDLQ